MFKHYFEQIQNVAIWPIISLVIFFLFFTGMLIYIFSLKKHYIEKMENLPFEDDQSDENFNS